MDGLHDCMKFIAWMKSRFGTCVDDCIMEFLKCVEGRKMTTNYSEIFEICYSGLRACLRERCGVIL